MIQYASIEGEAYLICKSCKYKVKKYLETKIPLGHWVPVTNKPTPDAHLIKHKKTKLYYIALWLKDEKTQFYVRIVKNTHTKNIVDACIIKYKILDRFNGTYYSAL